MGFMNDLNDMFNKGAAAAGDVFNKGASAASRLADTANLRFRQSELDRQWKDTCAQLGESLINAVKERPELLEGREDIIASLDAIANDRSAIAAELERIAAEAEASRQGAAPRICPECGANVTPEANFCMACGHAMPIDVKPEPEPAPTPETEEEASQEAAPEQDATAEATPKPE